MMYFGLLFILLLTGYTFSGDEFLPVSGDCKYWDNLNIYRNGNKKHLHCILDQENVPGLVNTTWKTINKGRCPIYNRHAKEIDTVSCNETLGTCPKESFRSYQVVEFTGCYRANLKDTNLVQHTVAKNEDKLDGTHLKDTKLVKQTVAKMENGLDCTDLKIAVAVLATSLMVSMLFIALFCVWHFICRSKIELCKGEYGRVETRVDEGKDHVAEVKGGCGGMERNDDLNLTHCASMTGEYGRVETRVEERKNRVAEVKGGCGRMERSDGVNLSQCTPVSDNGEDQRPLISTRIPDTESRVSVAAEPTTQNNTISLKQPK